MACEGRRTSSNLKMFKFSNLLNFGICLSIRCFGLVIKGNVIDFNNVS